MPIAADNGSNASWATEYFLVSGSTTATYQTDDAIIQVFIDFQNLASGDEYRVRVYENINGTGDPLPLYDVTVVGTQPHPLVTPSLVVMDGWEVSIVNVAGTSTRTIDWSIRKIT